jgi:hypothetical protein
VVTSVPTASLLEASEKLYTTLTYEIVTLAVIL